MAVAKISAQVFTMLNWVFGHIYIFLSIRKYILITTLCYFDAALETSQPLSNPGVEIKPLDMWNQTSTGGKCKILHAKHASDLVGYSFSENKSCSKNNTTKAAKKNDVQIERGHIVIMKKSCYQIMTWIYDFFIIT